tara:strand:- start:1431 stop:2864 length:1434 start_codon:yes stop_codon:yes gene_type:complete
MKNLKLSHRILIAMFALIFFSFITVGLITIIRYQSKNKSYHKERLQRKDRAVVESIKFMTNDTLILEHSFENLDQISQIHNLDLRIFDLNGSLVRSSKNNNKDNYIEKNTFDLLNKKILNKEKNIKQIYNNIEGDLEIYTVLYNKKDIPYAILNIPYKADDLKNINDEIRNEVMVLLSIYIFLFFISAIMALALLRQITRPLKMITKKLGSLDINQQNEQIDWPVKDEIGMLISQYNQLLIELKQKAEELAKSERKSAWKNMAKQIAHEIKNPLTPMRLSVQHFERIITKENPDLQPKVLEFSKMLIQQIDTMNSVVSAFSNFASLGNEKNEEFFLEDEVGRLVGLYKDQGIKFQKPDYNCLVKIDKSHLTRVLNNIIKNAIESISEKKTKNILILIKSKNNFWEIQIQDNGSGIPESLQEKIFEPKFTTKNSGMGLGLAMVKNIIDDFGGQITFISKLEKGTTFYINIPKHDETGQ